MSWKVSKVEVAKSGDLGFVSGTYEFTMNDASGKPTIIFWTGHDQAIDLEADTLLIVTDVDADGRIRIRGRGLLLASGNSIGQNANQSVFATVFCEATAPFVERSTALTGAARLAKSSASRPRGGRSCSASKPSKLMLLIRSSGNGTWFAAGIPKLGDN